MYVAIAVQLAVLIVQQHRNKAGLPVVAVNDVRIVIHVLERFEHCAAEECEAEAFLLVAGVDLLSPEHGEVVHKIELDVVLLEHIDAAEDGIASELQVEVTDMLHLQNVVVTDLRILRQHDRNFGALSCKFLRKRTDDVRKTAGLNEREAFACRKQYFHDDSPFAVFIRSDSCGRRAECPHIP